VLAARATVPMDLSLRPVAQRMLDLPLSGSITADSTDLSVIETFSPAFARAVGRFDANLTIGGTWREPSVQGLVEIARGAVTLSKLGVRYENVQARLRFFGDSLNIDTLTARSDGDAFISGYISAADWADPRFRLEFKTRRPFHIMNRGGVADVYLETAGLPLRLFGRKSNSTLSGSLTANGSVFVSEAVAKRVVNIDDAELARLIDTNVVAYRSLLPTASPAIVRNMRVQGVNISAGDDLRLRSEEANVKLRGTLRLNAGAQTRPGELAARALSYEGELQATEGTYRLNLGPVQRTFNVQSGTVRFFNDPDIEPAIEIVALHTVPQPNQQLRQDVQIRASISGTLSRLTLRLDSPDAHISQSDAISYLLWGVPNFSIGGRTRDYGTILNRAFLTSLGSALSGGGGGVVSDVYVSIGGTGEGYGGNVRSLGGNLLAGTRVGAGLRINDRTTARLDAGLCQLGQVAAGNSQGLDPVAFADAMGGKIDVRVKTGLTLSVGIEPATSALMCAQGSRARGFVPTPRQFGFDLLRLWRF
jgi:translocation and assembly module TamB